MATLVALFVLVWFISYVAKLAYVWWTGNGTIEWEGRGRRGFYVPHFNKKG